MNKVTFLLASLVFSSSVYATNVKELESSCNDGFLNSCTDLGQMYEQGQFVKRDYSKASALYSVACNNSYGEACNRLGLLYSLKGNREKAIKYYRIGCSFNDKFACTNLSRY